MKFVFRLFVTFLAAILGVCITIYFGFLSVKLFQAVQLCAGFVAVSTFIGGLLAIIGCICSVFLFSLLLFVLYSDWVDDAF